MSIGSAFDAHAKSFLHQALYGKNHAESPKYEFETIFEAQVEPHNRNWAREHGQYVFDRYKDSGALADLMIELHGAIDPPRFEFDVKGVIAGHREGITKSMMGVPLLGKPDVRFVNEEGAHVIYDWKVNGYCGKSNKSPLPGYVELREHDGNHWKRCSHHKDCLPQKQKGLWVNAAGPMEKYEHDWATQLCTYGWLLGEPVGAETVVGVDQIVANGAKRIGGRPLLRVASHRTKVSERFQFEVMARYQNLWSILVTTPFYFFREISFKDSAAKCKSLDSQGSMMSKGAGNSDIDWVNEAARMS